MLITLDINYEPNKKFLYNLAETDFDVGLFFVVPSSVTEPRSIFTYEVIDEKLFFLSVIKHGLIYNIA